MKKGKQGSHSKKRKSRKVRRPKPPKKITPPPPPLPFSEPLNCQVFNYKYLFYSIAVTLKRIQAKQTAPLNKGGSINWSKKRPAWENLMLIVTKTF